MSVDSSKMDPAPTVPTYCQEDVEKCANGWIQRLEPTVKVLSQELGSVHEKQIHLNDKIEAEKIKFVKSLEVNQLNEMVQKTRDYHQKLCNLQQEMGHLSQRSQNFKLRGLKLQELKQKEALKKELKRQKELEKEDQLIAKPSKNE